MIQQHLNFDDAWRRADHSNVYPQLGRFDQLNLLATQGPSYGDMEIDVWGGGHLYHVIHANLIREKLLGLLPV